MNNLKHVFDFGTIPIFLAVFCGLIIFCLIALYYMSTNIQKEQQDNALRIIIFQMIIATFIQNASRIILFIVTIFFSKCTQLFCQITESFIETTTATIPFLFSSYIIVYFKRIFPSSIAKLSITQLNIFLTFINWILPCLYWVMAIWLSNGLHVYSDTCMYVNYTISLFHNGCCLLMNGIGLGVGYLMKRRLGAKGDKESGLHNKVLFYIVMNVIYSTLFAVKIIVIIVNKKDNVDTAYNAFDNVIFCLLPAVFFVGFCFECNCWKGIDEKENRIDSSFEDERIVNDE